MSEQRTDCDVLPLAKESTHLATVGMFSFAVCTWTSLNPETFTVAVALREADEWKEKLATSTDAASAFDSVDAGVVGKSVIQRGASTFSAEAAVRDPLSSRCRHQLSCVQCARHVGPGLSERVVK